MATDVVDLTVTVDPSPDHQSGCYITGSNITGKVLFKHGSKNTSAADYKRITLSFIGKADVYFSLDDSEQDRHYQETDVFCNEQIIVWEKMNELEEISTTCTNVESLSMQQQDEVAQFPFTFSLSSQSGNLPASAECKDGRIRYTIEAKLIRDLDCEIEAAVAYCRLPVSVTVDINRSDLLVPRIIQNDTSVSQGCFGGGSLSIIASLSRSGYCIVNGDQIYVVVKVDSENGRRLNSLSISLLRRVTCYAQGQSSVVTDILATKENTRLPAGGISFSWNPPPIIVQHTDCTLTNCSIIKIHYFVRTSFSGRCISLQNLDMPIIMGNIPYNKDRSKSWESLETTHGSHIMDEYQPSLSPPSGQKYEPPAIPFMPTFSQSSHHSLVHRKDTALDEFYDDYQHDRDEESELLY